MAAMEPRQTPLVPIDQAARLLGVSPVDLMQRFPRHDGLSATELDGLIITPPTWLLEAKADHVLVSVFAEVAADLEAALGRTDAVVGMVADATLSNDEVAALLDLPAETISVFEPRRGWTADAVADLLRQQPRWMQSASNAREESRKAAWRLVQAEERRRYSAEAKVRTKERNRARWAEIAGVPLDEVPASFTKHPTPEAIVRFWKRPPTWAPQEPSSEA